MALLLSFPALLPASPPSGAGTSLPTISLVPVAASGNYLIDGNEIVVSPGAFVYLEIRVAHWDSDGDGTPLLSAYQVTMDPSSYSSGAAGELAPWTIACNHAYICAVQTYIGPCNGGGCCIEGSCASAAINQERDDYVFSALHQSSEVDALSADGRFMGASLVVGVEDPGIPVYAGTIVLDIPGDAAGTFTVRVSESSADTFLTDDTGAIIAPLAFEPATIVVPSDGQVFAPQNRFLTIRTGRWPGQQESIQVTLADLDGEFAAWNGTTFWVGEPTKVSASGSRKWRDAVGGDDPFIWVAELGCQRWFENWAQFPGPVHVYHELIVPNSRYEIQLVFQFADANELTLSGPVVVSTAPWGDVAGPFDPVRGQWARPDGSVDITSDAIAILDGFRASPTAPVKTRVDLEPAVPDGVINITDLLMMLTAFQGGDYPFAASAPDPCP